MKGQYKNIHEKLIKACKKGDRKAQFELYKQYSKAMYNTSFRILKDSAEAEDAMQDGFLKAFQNIDTYSGTVSFGAWLKRIIVNTSLDALRKRKVEFEDISELNLKIPEEETSEDEEELNLKIEKVKEAMLLLPDGYRVVLSLYLLEGYDHDEIAEIMNVSSSTSRSQLARARKKLLELLESNK
ncbi:MAG: RNA polymerase sigma factor [Chloroflexia bacterium]|nr:RNA polymerase sigma factor [Chloroflexia bacterium]